MSSSGPIATTPDRTARSSQTEAGILEAARNLLAEGGKDALSMRVVAERVGLSATAIYRYFDGKDDLVDHVVRGGYQRFGAYLAQATEAHAPGSLERIFAVGRAYIRFAFENREYFRVLYNIQKPEPRDMDSLPGGGGYGLLRGLVVEAIEAGAMRDADPDLVAHFLWASVHGLVTLALACKLEPGTCPNRGDVPATPELFDSFVPFLTEGLAAGNGKKAE